MLLALVVAVAGGTPASATKKDDNGEHKVWVCHATSGLGELKNGYNLIHVDVASTKGQAHLAHATTDPKNNSRFGLLYDYIDVDPNNLPGKCGETPPPPEQPDDLVEVTPWVDGTFECEDTTVEQTRIVTTTVYVLVDGEWVKGQPTSEEETQTRELSQDEIFACPTTPTTPPTVTTVDECDPAVEICEINGPATVDTPSKPIPDECWLDSNPLTALPAGSFTIYGDNLTAPGTHSRSGMACGPVEVATAQPPTPATASLPATGAENWVIAAIAVGLIAAGGALLRARRL